MSRGTSRYANHPRVTWFGIGSVAYVDFKTATTSWFIGSFHGGTRFKDPLQLRRRPGDGCRAVLVIPPNSREELWFDTMDDGIEYALAQPAEAVR